MKIYNIALWYASSFALILGAVLPMFTFHKFFIFNDSFSLLSGIIYLLNEGELLLFMIILVFSIIIPIIKMKLLYLIISNKMSEDKKKIISNKLLNYGKWSMLDVLVVAILIASVKLGSMANVEAHFGLYIFAIGVLGSMWLTKNVNA